MRIRQKRTGVTMLQGIVCFAICFPVLLLTAEVSAVVPSSSGSILALMASAQGAYEGAPCYGISGGTIAITQNSNYGQIANSAAPGGIEWHFPIGGVGHVSASGWSDRDWSSGVQQCVSDSLSYSWSVTSAALTLGSPSSQSMTVIASDDPKSHRTTTWDALSVNVDDGGAIYNDPYVTSVRAIRVVLPSSESISIDNIGCGVEYGCKKEYTITLRYLTDGWQTLDWSHCQVSETERSVWQDIEVDGCGLLNGTLATGGLWNVGVDNTLTGVDNVWYCEPQDRYIAFYCVSRIKLKWNISSDGAFHNYHRPAYSLSLLGMGGNLASLQCARASGDWPLFDD